jgi:hypothetical protein
MIARPESTVQEFLMHTDSTGLLVGIRVVDMTYLSRGSVCDHDHG